MGGDQIHPLLWHKRYAALPALLRWVGDTNELIAEASVHAVREVGRGQPAALAAISKALESPNRYVRQAALENFDNAERFGAAANPLLIRSMEHTNAGGRWDAFYFLSDASPTEMTNPVVLATAARHLCSTDADRQELVIDIMRAASEQAAGIRPQSYGYHLVNKPEWKLPDATNAFGRLAPVLYSNYFLKNVR